MRRELLWLHSCLLLSNTSFILLLSLDISVAFLLCVCFRFFPFLEWIYFCKSERQFWNYTFILFYLISFHLRPFKVYIENIFALQIDLLSFTDGEIIFSSIQEAVPGVLMKVHRTCKWNLNITNRFWAWILELIAYTIIGGSVRKLMVWANAERCLLDLYNLLVWDFWSQRTSGLE